jgi:hypothetical protein
MIYYLEESLQRFLTWVVGGSVQCAPGPFPAGVGGANTRYNGIVHGSNRGFAPNRSQ